ncbi:YtxH domain-containing protein [Lapidilactobacillus bayanensis]|uniref:YtxH domain-containing protein n=1 Tax=Lapidilactobacillus bayanensis TaxID=2485998 RepID=UPI000F76A26D|nr:YtxH domain-containing protein [Lapidilactobacillus bayanensis]
MAKFGFGKGLLIGAVLGTAYVLLTSEKTGKQRQQGVTNYFKDLTHATNNVATSVKEFQNAVTNLHHEVEATLKPTIAEIQQTATDFQFQAQPRLDQINESTEQLQQDLARFDSATDHSAE